MPVAQGTDREQSRRPRADLLIYAGFGDVARQRLMKDYTDLPMDLADASLLVLAEHLGDGRILATDERDFRTYRWKNRKPFMNLLLSLGEGQR